MAALLHTLLFDLLAVGWPHHTGLRQHGRAWKKIASELKNRTPEMVAALYEQNGGYLSLPPEHTSALVRVPFFIAFQPPPTIWFGPVWLLLWVHLLAARIPARAYAASSAAWCLLLYVGSVLGLLSGETEHTTGALQDHR